MLGHVVGSEARPSYLFRVWRPPYDPVRLPLALALALALALPLPLPLPLTLTLV